LKQEQYFEIAYRVQERLNFYLVALTFTVLGLSVQTSRFGRGTGSDAFELLGWVALLISGLIGVRRLERMPHVFRLFALRSDPLTVLDEAHIELATQEGKSPEDPQSGLRELMRKLNARIDEMQKEGRTKYRNQRYFLIAGLVALMVARGLPPLVNLFGYRLLGADSETQVSHSRPNAAGASEQAPARRR